MEWEKNAGSRLEELLERLLACIEPASRDIEVPLQPGYLQTMTFPTADPRFQIELRAQVTSDGTAIQYQIRDQYGSSLRPFGLLPVTRTTWADWQQSAQRHADTVERLRRQ